MTISSRTPEGEPARCPLCNADIAIEPSIFIGDGTCPRCGQLIWFIQNRLDTRTFSRHGNGDLRDRALELISQHLGVDRERIANNPSFLTNLGADSLDTVELVMELQEELNIFDD